MGPRPLTLATKWGYPCLSPSVALLWTIGRASSFQDNVMIDVLEPTHQSAAVGKGSSSAIVAFRWRHGYGTSE